jgi:hypothetical protein
MKYVRETFEKDLFEHMCELVRVSQNSAPELMEKGWENCTPREKDFLAQLTFTLQRFHHDKGGL